eukprot:tig00020553_g10537.t1
MSLEAVADHLPGKLSRFIAPAAGKRYDPQLRRAIAKESKFLEREAKKAELRTQVEDVRAAPERRKEDRARDHVAVAEDEHVAAVQAPEEGVWIRRERETEQEELMSSKKSKSKQKNAKLSLAAFVGGAKIEQPPAKVKEEPARPAPSSSPAPSWTSIVRAAREENERQQQRSPVSQQPARPSLSQALQSAPPAQPPAPTKPREAWPALKSSPVAVPASTSTHQQQPAVVSEEVAVAAEMEASDAAEPEAAVAFEEVAVSLAPPEAEPAVVCQQLQFGDAFVPIVPECGPIKFGDLWLGDRCLESACGPVSTPQRPWSRAPGRSDRLFESPPSAPASPFIASPCPAFMLPAIWDSPSVSSLPSSPSTSIGRGAMASFPSTASFSSGGVPDSPTAGSSRSSSPAFSAPSPPPRCLFGAPAPVPPMHFQHSLSFFSF